MVTKPKNDLITDLITVKEWERRTGESSQSVYTRINRGLWMVKKHFYRRGRSIRLNLHECSKWYTGQ